MCNKVILKYPSLLTLPSEISMLKKSICRGEIFLLRSLGQSYRGKYPHFFADTGISLKHSVGLVERSLHAKNRVIDLARARWTLRA